MILVDNSDAIGLPPPPTAATASAADRVLLNSCVASSGDVQERCVIEHSALSGAFFVGAGSIVSHLQADFGRDLRLRAGMLLQQVPLHGLPAAGIRSPAAASTTSTATSAAAGGGGWDDSSPRVLSALLVMGVRDDAKLHYLDPAARVCGHSWDLFFQVNCAVVNTPPPPRLIIV